MPKHIVYRGGSAHAVKRRKRKPVRKSRRRTTQYATLVDNAFCPTGPGGGIDPTCPPGGPSSAVPSQATEIMGRPPDSTRVVGDNIHHVWKQQPGERRQMFSDVPAGPATGANITRLRNWARKGGNGVVTTPHNITLIVRNDLVDNTVRVGPLSEFLYGVMDEITKGDATEIARVIRDGVAAGASVEDVAAELVSRAGLEEARADLVARTELTRAHATEELEGGGFMKFVAHDGACPLCKARHGKRYPAKTSGGIIPVHPGCQCAWEPLKAVATENELAANANCGIGPGGFQKGNTCARGGEGVHDLPVLRGGPAREGKHVTYHSTSREMAESYVSMYNDRFGSGGAVHESKISIHNPAPQDVIEQEAKKAGVDNEGYTPASVFDTNLHGDEPVKRLVNRLKRMGHDGAVLDDIGYGPGIEGKTYITFTGANKRKSSGGTTTRPTVTSLKVGQEVDPFQYPTSHVSSDEKVIHDDFHSPGRAVKRVGGKWIITNASNCGIGPGGFQKGNTCAKGGRGGAVSLPKDRKRASIAKSAAALSGKGYSLGAASHDLKTGKTTYTVATPSGTKVKMTADEVKDLAYGSPSPKKKQAKSADPSGATRVKAKLGGHDVEIAKQPDGTGLVVKGPPETIGKKVKKKGGPVPESGPSKDLAGEIESLKAAHKRGEITTEQLGQKAHEAQQRAKSAQTGQPPTKPLPSDTPPPATPSKEPAPPAAPTASQPVSPGQTVATVAPVRFTGREDRSAAQAHAMATHGEWGRKLPDEQKAALKTYADDAGPKDRSNYTEINSGLRTKAKDPSTGSLYTEKHAETIRHLDAAIASAPPLDREHTTYRGVSTGVLDKMVVGSDFVDHGYTSTSINRHIATGFVDDALIEVKLPKGFRAAAMDATGQAYFTGEQSENEYVLPRGTKYKVTGRSKHPDGYDVVHVEALPS